MYGVVLGIYVSYSETGGLSIFTKQYLKDFYSQKAIENGYDSINVNEDNYNTIAHNMLLVSKNNKYGIVDLSYKELVGTKYNEIEFNESTNEFIVSSNNKYGIVNSNGNIKVSLIYDEISIINYAPLLYKVKNDNKYGIIDSKGNLLTELIYDEIGYPEDKENKTEYTVIIPALDEEIKQSIIVRKDNQYGLVDAQTGEVIIECTLEKIYKYNENNTEKYEAIFSGQKVDLKQYIKAVNTIVVNV